MLYHLLHRDLCVHLGDSLLSCKQLNTSSRKHLRTIVTPDFRQFSNADAAFYSGYVNGRMRPHDQVAWGDGRSSNATDKTGTTTVSMTDYPPLTRNEQNQPGTSSQGVPPGFGKSISTENGTSGAKSSLSKADRSARPTSRWPVQQAFDGNQQATDNRVTNVKHGQSADTSGYAGRDATGISTRTTGANYTPGTHQTEKQDSATNK